MECLSVLLLSVAVSDLNSCSDNKLPQTTQRPEASQHNRRQCACQNSWQPLQAVPWAPAQQPLQHSRPGLSAD